MVGNHQEVLYSDRERSGPDWSRIEAQSSCSLTLNHNEHNNNFTQTSPWAVPTVDTPGPWWPNRPVPGDYSPSPRCPRCPVARVSASVPARVFPGQVYGHQLTLESRTMSQADRHVFNRPHDTPPSL